MTAFDFSQRATVQIDDGNPAAALASLDAALRRIERDGVDADLAPDLRSLRAMVARNAAK